MREAEDPTKNANDNGMLGCWCKLNSNPFNFKEIYNLKFKNI